LFNFVPYQQHIEEKQVNTTPSIPEQNRKMISARFVHSNTTKITVVKKRHV
jgi:hypothetical protein